MRILMLGNSFTAYNNMPQMVAKLTGAEVRSHTRGGARLAEQFNPQTQMGARTMDALTNEKWDYVVIQAMSKGPIVGNKAYMRNVGRLCQLAREAGARPVIYATWAYQEGSEILAKMKMSYDEMYQALHDAYLVAAEVNDALMADVGTAFAQKHKEIELYDPDGRHPSAEGSWLAARVIADTILA